MHPKSNNNGIRLANFATLKNLIVKSTKFPYCNIHKYTCDTDHYLVVPTIREGPSLKKGIKQHLVTDRYNLNKLLDHETRNEYPIDIANRFSVLKSLEISSVDSTWIKIRDSIKSMAEEKVGILETHRNKPWFDEECSELAKRENR